MLVRPRIESCCIVLMTLITAHSRRIDQIGEQNECLFYFFGAYVSDNVNIILDSNRETSLGVSFSSSHFHIYSRVVTILPIAILSWRLFSVQVVVELNCMRICANLLSLSSSYLLYATAAGTLATFYPIETLRTSSRMFPESVKALHAVHKRGSISRRTDTVITDTNALSTKSLSVVHTTQIVILPTLHVTSCVRVVHFISHLRVTCTWRHVGNATRLNPRIG